MAEDIPVVGSERSRKKDMLKMYYGLDDSATPTSSSDDPLDIDSSNFNAERYLRKLKQVPIVKG